jgi:RHS repeat-associated protein
LTARCSRTISTGTCSTNARNRLTGITGPIGATFQYDATGRRTRKTINGLTTDLVHDGINPVTESSPGGTGLLLTGLGVDDFLLRSGPGGTSMFLTDALGSLVATTDFAGAVQSEVTYEPFGATVLSAPAPAYRFTGREQDEPLPLYYYRARYYHPGLQRFLSEDPIEFAGGDPNLYLYVANNPIRYTDELGLKLDLEYAGSLAAALQRVRTTQRGASIFDTLERSSNVYRIRETAGSERTHYDPDTLEIVVNTIRPSVVCTTAGRKPMPPEAALAHEGGHALGFPDAGPNNMVNVNANENPVRRALGYPIRLTYGGTQCPP